jgi:hypothetical protein
MLYLPQDNCEIGIPHFSDKAQIMKWKTFIRRLAVKGTPASNIKKFYACLLQPTLPGEEHLKTVTTPWEWPRLMHFTAGA